MLTANRQKLAGRSTIFPSVNILQEGMKENSDRKDHAGENSQKNHGFE
jgi:hypothetical protein